MKAKHELVRGERLFYCFVDFCKSPIDRPFVFVVPVAVVADVLALAHRTLLATPGKKGQACKDSDMRRLSYGTHDDHAGVRRAPDTLWRRRCRQG